MDTPLPAPVPPSPSASAPPPADGWAVPAGHGLDWWTSAWRLFTAAPGAWIVITIVYLVIMIVLSSIPLLGQFAVSFLHPVLLGGIVLGCREQDRGGALAVSHLFAGFSEKLGPLVILALLYFAGWLADRLRRGRARDGRDRRQRVRRASSPATRCRPATRFCRR